MKTNIILPETIIDLQEMNPGCDIDNIVSSRTGEQQIDFEFLKIPKSELEFRKIPSLDNKYEINENGTILRNVNTKRNLKIFLDNHHSKFGYYASFINFKGIVRRVMIHKIVAECWIGPKPDNLEIDHIDRNSHNNHYTNLRYVTHSEQMKNRILSPRIINQAKRNCRKYLVEEVMKPVKVIENSGEILSFESISACARYLSDKYNCKFETVRKEILGKRKSKFKDSKIFYVNERVIKID